MIMKELIYLETLKVCIQFLSPNETKEIEIYIKEKMDQCMQVAMKGGVDIEVVREKYSIYESLIKLL